MPRLTTSKYLEAHRQLRQSQLDDGTYAQISERDQVELHLFLCPRKDWSDDELLEHRRVISNADPSLPQRAGRAPQMIRACPG